MEQSKNKPGSSGREKESSSPVYFKQLLVGREVAVSPSPNNPYQQLFFNIGSQMKNFVYLVGNAVSKECYVVDPAWDIEGIINYAQKDGMKIVGAILTHYHFDHCGGKPPPPFASYGINVPGIKDLLEKCPDISGKIVVNKFEVPLVLQYTGISKESLKIIDDGEVLSIGNDQVSIQLRFLHTPGHSAGSQCILILTGKPQKLITGDTLFIGSYGRVDLPDSNFND